MENKDGLKEIKEHGLYDRKEIQKLFKMSYKNACTFFNHPKLKKINAKPELVLGKHLIEHLENLAE